MAQRQKTRMIPEPEPIDLAPEGPLVTPGFNPLADFANSRRAPSDEGLVSLDRLAEAAHLRPKERLAHCLADAHHQEPRRFQADIKHAMQLMRAHALL